jgi:hypothetical protein
MARRSAVVLAFVCPLLAAGAVASAQQPTVIAEQVECLPIADNGVAWATVENGVPNTTTRLYFRRLHDTVEDFYWVQMYPSGDGRYWGVFPKAEDRELDRHELEEAREHREAAWWRAKEASTDRDPNDDLDDEEIEERATVGRQESRHWMLKMDDEAFEDFLDQLENEPAEYFVAVFDGEGRKLAVSETLVVEVLDDCDTELTEVQRGEAENLIVGETSQWQHPEEVFHWLCDGVVTRVGPDGVKRGDQVCRACIPGAREFISLRDRAVVSPFD